MAWKAVDPDATDERRVPDQDGAPTIIFGYWPPAKAEAFASLIQNVVKAEDVDPAVAYEMFLQREDLRVSLYYDMVRYGVRGWKDDGALPGQSSTSSVTIHGRTHAVLSDDSLHLLAANRLITAVGFLAWKFKSLSPEQKKTSKSPSAPDSSETRTDAQNAIPPVPKESHTAT